MSLQAQCFDCYAKGCRTADGWRAAHDHVMDAFGDRRGGNVTDVANLARQHALIDQLELIVAPAQGIELRPKISHQMTRSLPPSTGICAPVVFANKGPHNSAASAATSRLVTSVFRTLLRLYCSTVRP